MNKKLVSLLLVASSVCPVVADDFADFKIQEQKLALDYKVEAGKEFEQYKKKLNAGFKEYRKTYLEESQKYRKQMTQTWGDHKESTRDVWINYSQNNNVRDSVNFKTGEVSVEVLVDKDTPIDVATQKAKDNVLILLATTEKQAFDNDVVANKVENSLQQFDDIVKSIQLSDDVKVMEPLLTLVKTGSEVKLKSVAKKLTANSQVKVREFEGKKIVRLSFNIPDNLSDKAGRYASKIVEIAKKENIPVSLVYAVMETESNFNPRAKSFVPAYGLMQIVPVSAGQDATKYLFGKAKILAPSYLYNSNKNIEIGGAYLHILYHRYLRKVENKTSRLFCAIAAYNTGAGNVAKSFIGTYNITKASKKINQLTSQQVYANLRSNLPHKETRDYIKRVVARMEKYQ